MSRQNLSKLGLYLSGAYVAISLVLWIYAFICQEMFCSFIIGVTLIPWIFVLKTFIPFPNNEILFYVASGALNIISLYLIGHLISLIIRKIRTKPSVI